MSQGTTGPATPHLPCDGHAEGWGCTCVPADPHTWAVRLRWVLLRWRLGCFCPPCAHVCARPLVGRALLPSPGIAGASQAVGVVAMLGACGGPTAGGREGLVPLFSAAFGETGQARAPCAAGSGPCRRMVACVALDGDMPLGKPCPRAPGQSPALARLQGSRAGHQAVSHHMLSTLGWARGGVLPLGRGEHQSGHSWHLSRAI